MLHLGGNDLCPLLHVGKAEFELMIDLRPESKIVDENDGGVVYFIPNALAQKVTFVQLILGVFFTEEFHPSAKRY